MNVSLQLNGPTIKPCILEIIQLDQDCRAGHQFQSAVLNVAVVSNGHSRCVGVVENWQDNLFVKTLEHEIS